MCLLIQMDVKNGTFFSYGDGSDDYVALSGEDEWAPYIALRNCTIIPIECN